MSRLEGVRLFCDSRSKCRVLRRLKQIQGAAGLFRNEDVKFSHWDLLSSQNIQTFNSEKVFRFNTRLAHTNGTISICLLKLLNQLSQ